MKFQSDKSDLAFGILSVPLKQRCWRENIRKNILVDAVSEGAKKTAMFFLPYLAMLCLRTRA